MWKIGERNFYHPKEDVPEGAIVPKLSDDERNLFKGLTQENVEMDRRVNREKERAERAEKVLSDRIDRRHRYTLQAVFFGGGWGVESWPDSVTIYDGNDIITIIAVPPMPPVYDKEDEMSISFFNPLYGMPCWLRFTRNGKNQMTPTGIYKPAFDNRNYTIGISTKKLPWILTE